MRLAVSRSVFAAFAAVGALSGALSSGTAVAQTLPALAKQQGCTAPPIVVEGTELYKCQTNGAMSYFSGPPSGATSKVTPAARPNGTPATKGATPGAFPRVESNVQRERDDVRKRVLTEELATEVRMLVESEVAMANGSAPQPGESVTSPKYLDRQARLRSTVENHNRNIQALNKEIQRLKARSRYGKRYGSSDSCSAAADDRDLATLRPNQTL